MPDLPPTTAFRAADGSIAPEYFETLYEADPDPWAFGSSRYEVEKYAATLSALPRARYRRAFEAGCSIGVLTRALADRCDALLAVDVAEAALAQARERTAGLPHVRIERRVLPEAWPAGRFDLVVVSEVGYYLAPAALDRLRQQCADAIEPGGHLALVHWTGETDYPLSGDAVHEAFLSREDHWRAVRSERTDRYRLDVLERQDPML